MFVVSLLVCTALVCAASSDDDHNLMQQGTAALHKRASAEEIHNAIAKVGEGLAMIPNPGKMRQMAIDSLMKSVSSTEEIDQASIWIFGNVSQLLTDILDGFKLQNQEDQIELDAIDATIQVCNSIKTSEDITRSQAAETAREAHADARVAEAALKVTRDTECASFSNFLQFLMSVQCEVPESGRDATTIAEWTTWFTSQTAFFTSHKSQFEGKVTACKDADLAWTTQKGVADVDQNTYENAFCQFRNNRVEMCTEQADCYTAKTNLHNTTLTNVVALGAERLAIAKVIYYLICVVENLMISETDTTLCDGGVHYPANITVMYDVTPPEIPDQALCDVVVVAIYPGHAGWTNHAYSTFSDNSPVTEVTGVQCD